MRLSLREASAKYGPSISALRTRVDTGQLPSYRLHPSGKIWVDSEDVEALMIQMNRPAPSPADVKARVADHKAFLRQLLASFPPYRKRTHV